MIAAGLRRLALRVAGTDGVSPEEQTRRLTLVLASVTVAVLALGWVGTYFALDRPLAAVIPFGYQALTIIGLGAVWAGAPFGVLRTSQIAAMSALPFFLQWVLGGYAASSAVSLWALVSALGAVFFVGAARAVPWFVMFAVLTIISALIDPALASAATPLPSLVRTTFFGLNVLGVAVTAYLMVQTFVRQREAALVALDAEHARSERLLLNVLPGVIAERLKAGSGIIADAHPAVTVLFADIVGFTAYAERTAPATVVERLDDLFSTFDDLVDRFGLEKIKTIGDSYMAVGGVPLVREDHVEAVARLGLAMIDEIGRLASPGDGSRFEIRIGIASGPVVAGVIGRRKFSYDLWGDVVNTAARMESSGVPGRIQVTAAVEERLRDRFVLEPRGEIEVKGKGRLATYFLVAAQSEAAATPPGPAPEPRPA